VSLIIVLVSCTDTKSVFSKPPNDLNDDKPRLVSLLFAVNSMHIHFTMLKSGNLTKNCQSHICSITLWWNGWIWN